MRIVLALLVLLSPATGFAQDANTKLYGLAMHGDPKYGPQDTHLEYANPDAPKGGTLKEAATGSFDTLNPYAIKGTAAKGLNLIYDRLMRRVWDEPFTMYPLIAERVDVPEDRSSITFHINPAAKFHDGSPITVADVLFSFETLKALGRPNMRRIYRLVEDVQTTDTAITFNFGEGYDRETVMIMALMPVLSKTWWEAREFESTLLEAPLTNGPYRVKSVDPGRKIVYERVPDYWAKDLLPNAGHYNFDEISYDYFRDDTVALEAFNKGTLNFRREFNMNIWLQSYDSKNLIQDEIAHDRPERVRALIFNMRREPFNDINIRKAMAMVFDEDWIGQNIYYGKQKRIKSYFPNSALAAPPEETPDTSQRQNMRAASQLLKDAGWNVVDGKRMKDNQTLSFELLLSAPEEEKVALNFKKSLQRLGIEMNIRVLDGASFQLRRQEYDYDMILHHWQNSLSPGTEQLLYWGCEAANQPGRFNYAGLCSEEVDATATAIANAQTYDDLIALAHKLDALLINEYMAIPLFYRGADYIAYRPPIKRPETVGIYGAVVETWWMDRAVP
ncbi:MAG: extracellular solute-binding protein [Pseudomonadota bacterium]